jgi:hypothetical protein
MADLWTSLGATALGGVIAAGAGIAGSIVQFRLRKTERAEERASDREERAAAAVGPMLSLLRELDPNAVVGALAHPDHPQAREVMDRNWTRWEAAQDRLEVVAAGYPSEEVRAACDTIIESTMNLLNRLHQAVIHEPARARSEAWWDEVNGFRDEARETARNLVRTMREAGD